MNRHDVRAVLQRLKDDLQDDGPQLGPALWSCIIKLRGLQPDALNDCVFLEVLERLHGRLEQERREDREQPAHDAEPCAAQLG